MGVSHLGNWAGKAQSLQNNHGSTDAAQVRGLHNPAYTSPSTKVPKVGKVDSFENSALHPTMKAPQPPKGNANGGRMGALPGGKAYGPLTDKLGETGAKRGMSGGRLG